MFGRKSIIIKNVLINKKIIFDLNYIVQNDTWSKRFKWQL